MKLLVLSIRLFILGCICDFLLAKTSRIAEKNISKNLPLTKKLLIILSNFSDNSLIKWQSIEREFIKRSLYRQYFGI